MNKIGKTVKQPNEEEFEQVKKLAKELWLDMEDLKREQFYVLSDNGNVIAFGRLREHHDSTELCTLGVSTKEQAKGYGIQMVNHLLKQAKRDVHLVTVIPGFFTKQGFNFVEKYPASLQKKVDMCSTHHNVGEIYRVMKWEKK